MKRSASMLFSLRRPIQPITPQPSHRSLYRALDWAPTALCSDIVSDKSNETLMPAAPPLETTTQAMAVLDAQFAWLRGAEKPVCQRRTRLPNSAQR